MTPTIPSPSRSPGTAPQSSQYSRTPSTPASTTDSPPTSEAVNRMTNSSDWGTKSVIRNAFLNHPPLTSGPVGPTVSRVVQVKARSPDTSTNRVSSNGFAPLLLENQRQ